MRDRDIRSALREQSLRVHIDDANTLVLDELGLLQGNSRVDIAVVNGELHGFELKSASDTLDRLPRQISAYSAVLDRVTLVLAENHYEDALGLVPAWWGVTLARERDGRIDFVEHRPAVFNLGIEPAALVQLLWRDEVLAELDRRGAARGVRSRPRRVLYARLAEVASVSELRDLVRTRLKARSGWRAGAPRT